MIGEVKVRSDMALEKGPGLIVALVVVDACLAAQGPVRVAWHIRSFLRRLRAVGQALEAPLDPRAQLRLVTLSRQAEPSRELDQLCLPPVVRSKLGDANPGDKRWSSMSTFAALLVLLHGRSVRASLR